jgi:GTP-binding protein
MSGLIAIVGRPNVGKSALFNRIVGRRIAIVHDQPGVTRDRITAEAEWNGRSFTLVDTGGIGLLRGEKSGDVIIKAAVEQVDIAIESAQVIILVVNAQEGVVPLDREVAQRLRASGKPVLVAANKVDTWGKENEANEFASLGFDKVFPVSAIHSLGIDDLVKAALPHLPVESKPVAATGDETAPETVEETAEDKDAPRKLQGPVGPLKLAIVGRPNVGKSSIINALTHSSRVIVSPIPGTTRDAVDVPFSVETEGGRQEYILIDTAGMRKTRRVDDTVEFFSVQRTEDSIVRSDITVLVIDAEMSITEQDKKIADVIVENRKACIVVVNKWDLYDESVRKTREEEIERRDRKQRTEGQEKTMSTLVEFGAWVQKKLFFLDYAPVIFTSATTGFHLDRLLEAVRYVASQLQQKVPTSILNRALRTAVDQRQPVSESGHRLKFYYATQVRLAPPTFLLFVNRDELFSDQYKKYLGGEMRKAFGYEGCPILLVPKPRPKTIEPMRKFLKPDQSGGKRLGRPQRATRPQRSQGSSHPARSQSRSGRPQERTPRPQSGAAREESRSRGPKARPQGRAPVSQGHPQGRPFAPKGAGPGAGSTARPRSFKKKHQRSHARGSNRAKGRRL